MSKAGNKADDSDSDELHVDLWFFERGNQIKECGWKKGKECVALKKEKECECVRLVSACLFGRKVKQSQSRFPKMVCCEVGYCVSASQKLGLLQTSLCISTIVLPWVATRRGRIVCRTSAGHFYCNFIIRKSLWIPKISRCL
jgi:hypothetical protein